MRRPGWYKHSSLFCLAIGDEEHFLPDWCQESEEPMASDHPIYRDLSDNCIFSGKRLNNSLQIFIFFLVAIL
jgi:hypothetical protein